MHASAKPFTFALTYCAALVSVVTCTALGLVQMNELLTAIGALGLLAIEVVTLLEPALMELQ